MKVLYWGCRLLMTYATAPLLGLALGVGVSLANAIRGLDVFLGLASAVGLGILVLAWYGWCRLARSLLLR